MKKKLVILSFVLVILISLTITFTQNKEVCAYREEIEIYDERYNRLVYAVENGEAVFLRYDCFDGITTEYQIPSYIDGYKVTVIGENAFHDSEFEKITIPNTVKTIEKYAFGGHYSKLKELNKLFGKT